MKRRTPGPLALLITLASAQLLAAQMLAAPGPSGVAPLGSMPYPPPGYGAGVAAPRPYPVQTALYAQSDGAPSQVQLASCPSCQPAQGGWTEGPMMSPGGPVSPDGMMSPPGYGYPIPMDAAVDCYGDACSPPDEWADGCGPGCGGQCAGWLHRLLARCAGLCARCGALGCSCGSFSHGPYGDGGCCLPRWYDVHAEWLYWTRDFNDSLQLASEGILGPDVLNINDLDFDWESGFRVTWAYPIAPAAALEVTYFGQLNWASSAEVRGDNNLFSVFSGFGSDPLNGYPQTDFASWQRVSLSTEIDNGELNWRHRWISANCLIHSSWMLGARYLRLREDLLYTTETETSGMSYRLKTDNDLVGAQAGTELYFCLTPRFKIGGEIEAGVYGTNSRQRTNVDCVDWIGLKERDHDNDVAFIGEGGVSALFRATPRLTLRAGYQVLFVDGVALAVDNFNTASPFTARDSFIDSDGSLLMHGAAAGFEWTW